MKQKLKQFFNRKKKTDPKIKIFDPTEKSGIAKIKAIIKKSLKKDQAIMVYMMLRNGKEGQFIVYPNGQKSFTFKGGEYVIDPDMMVENISTGLFCLHYHQDICIPFKEDIEVEDIIDAVEKSEDMNTAKAINPNNLKTFMTSEVIEKVLKGEELEKYLKSMKFFLIITMLLAAAAVLILVNETGMLSNLNLPIIG